MTRRLAYFALIFNTLIWGATFVVVKETLERVSPVLFLALRFSIATVALLLLFRSVATAWKAGSTLRGGMLAGVFLFAGYAFQTIGLQFTSAPNSAFITGLATVMVPLLAAAVYQKRPRVLEVGGVVLAASGMGLMTLQSTTLTMNRGDLLTLICAIAFAAHILTVGHWSGEAGFETFSLVQVGVAAGLSLCTFWWVEPAFIRWSPNVVLALLLTGLLATALAFTLQAWAQRYTTATRTALIFTLEPVFAWATSYLLTGETLSKRGALGAFLILAGLLLVEVKPWKPLPHP